MGFLNVAHVYGISAFIIHFPVRRFPSRRIDSVWYRLVGGCRRDLVDCLCRKLVRGSGNSSTLPLTVKTWSFSTHSVDPKGFLNCLPVVYGALRANVLLVAGLALAVRRYHIHGLPRGVFSTAACFWGSFTLVDFSERILELLTQTRKLCKPLSLLFLPYF